MYIFPTTAKYEVDVYFHILMVFSYYDLYPEIVIFPTYDFLYGLWFVNFNLFFKRTLKLIRKILNNDYSKIHADFISLIRHIYKNTSLHEHPLIIIIVSTRKKQLSQFNYFMYYTLAYTMVIKVTSYNIWKI